jgi:hypothetical protein
LVGIGQGVELNSYVAYVFRRVLNSRYTKFGWNRLRGYRVNLKVATPNLVGIGQGVKELNSYVAYVSCRILNSRYTKFGWNRLRG